MEGTHHNSPTTSDELDLMVLLENVISYLRRFAKLFMSFVAAGLLIGLFLFLNSPKKYTSKLVLHSYILTNLENIQIIESWKELLKRKEYSVLTSSLNCEPAMLKKISSISAEEIQKLYISNNPHGFVVKAVVKDTSILDKLQEGIIYGLSNNEYIKEKLAVKKSNLGELIAKVTNQITKLDSTKRDVENIISNKNKNSSSLMVDVSNINTELVNLNEKLLAYKEELRFASSVQVLQPFNKFSNSESRRPILLMTVGMIAGFLISYVISLIIYVRQMLISRSMAKKVTAKY